MAGKKKSTKNIKYSAAIAAQICERLQNGDTLQNICASKTMPTMQQVYQWAAERKKFQTQFHEAITGQPKPSNHVSSFDKKIFDIVCERMAAGHSLRSVCADESLPDESTIRKWALEDDARYTQYTRARGVQADSYVDELIAISDGAGDLQQLLKELGIDDLSSEKKIDAKMLKALVRQKVERDRLKIETRKWLISKILRTRFGDKVSQEITGPNGEPLNAANNQPILNVILATED